MPDNIPHFTRDPSLASDIADQFGGNAARAEQLIMAASLRQSPELQAANLLPENIEARGKFSDDDVKKAADLDDDQLLPNSHTVRGQYLVYLFEMPDGRVGKDALLIDGDKLSAPDRPETPERASLRASVNANRKVREAQADADEIIAKAKEEAAQILADAAAKAEKERSDDLKEASKAIDEQEGEDSGHKPRLDPGDSGVRTPQGRPPGRPRSKGRE
jgi:hypothetical protein